MTTNAGVTIAGYSHVAISVTDLDAARDFYCGLLGFEELPRPDFGFPGLWLRVGDLQLHLGEVEEMPSSGGGFPPHFALFVPTEEFEATIGALQAAGVTMFGEATSRVDFGTKVWQAFAADPSGNVVELTNAGPVAAR